SGGRERFAFLDDALRERMADAVKIGIFHILAAAVWSGMDVFLWEWILRQDKGVLAVLKVGKRLQIISGELPKTVIKLGEIIAALPVADFQFFVDFLVKVFEQLSTGLLHLFVNLRLQLFLQRVKI